MFLPQYIYHCWNATLGGFWPTSTYDFTLSDIIFIDCYTH
jgi:hypothetical protein